MDTPGTTPVRADDEHISIASITRELARRGYTVRGVNTNGPGAASIGYAPGKFIRGYTLAELQAAADRLPVRRTGPAAPTNDEA